MQEIASANASRCTAEASSDSAPVDDAIVAAPKAAGIAAATNDWKTSSNAMNSSGSAISSAVDRRQRVARALGREQRHAGDRGAHGRRGRLVDEPLRGLAAARDLLAGSRDREQEQRAVARRA
jgi:hypothetical protein